MPDVRIEDLTVTYSGPAGVAVANARARQLYAEFGCFLARGLLGDAELEPIRASIRRLISLRMENLGLRQEPSADQPPDFDDGFVRLGDLDVWNKVVIMGGLARSLPLHQLGLSPKLTRLSRMLMATDTILTSTLGAVQVQQPQETRHLLPWHQDYPYTRDSEDGLVYWIPLRELEEHNSALQVAPGSHRLGVLPMRGHGPRPPEGDRVLRIADLSVLERFPQLTVHVSPGDVLVFSTLLLHASVLNRSTQVRWTVQIRHGNFEYSRAVARDWPATRPGAGSFEETHPEYYLESVEDAQAPA
jgi:hypothetical protein